MTEANRIIILDTTLRDGEQTPGINLNLQEKLEIARQLEKLGVDVIEAGFPAVSEGDYKAVRAISASVKCSVAALCRCVKSDIARAADALKAANKPRIHIFIATSPIHMEYKLRKTSEEVLALARESVAYAKSLCEDVEFSCEDASRSDKDFLCEILEAVIDAGATTVDIADTVGYAMPEEFGALVKYLIENTPNMSKAVFGVHCHDDLGLAVANTLSAIQNGARHVEVTINGIGERAGNCALEEIIMGLSVRSDALGPYTHSIKTKRLYRTSARVAKITSLPVPVNKAVVGDNAFSHESGIHQHGMMQNPMTYEIMTPESVGKPESTMVLGKHSGRHAFDERLRSMGYDLPQEELDGAFARFKELADRRRHITDDEIEALVSHKVADVPFIYKLEAFQYQSASKMKAMASITLLHDGKLISEAAIGAGPVDAAYSAVSRIVGGEWVLAAYDIKAITEGEDALGEVTVRVKRGNRLYTGKGLAPDIIESSVRAFVNAVNRAMAEGNGNGYRGE